MPFIIDAHEDLAYNHFVHRRDILRSAAEMRQLEAGTPVPDRTGQTLLGWPDYQRGQVAMVFSTLFVAPRRYAGAWESEFAFATQAESYRQMRNQLDYYLRLCEEHPDKFRLVTGQKSLAAVLQPWEQTPASYPQTTHPVGMLVLMEGAEGVRDAGELEEWWQAGVRIIGPVWAGTRLCGGTIEPGAFSAEGLEMLSAMAGLGFILDISHMSDESALTALDRYEGPIIASHANARALHKDTQNQRHLTDVAMRRLFERGGVMGVIPYNRFINLQWTLEDGRHTLTLDHLIAHIDHACQIAGDARHVALGTDFDGGYGWPAVPEELDTIADMQKLAPRLLARGYQPEDVAAILGGNWRRVLEQHLPIQ